MIDDDDDDGHLKKSCVRTGGVECCGRPKMESEVDGDERVIATAEQIVRRLGTTSNMTHDMLNILSTFDHRFSNITGRLEAHLEERLHSAEKLLLQWDSVDSSASARSHHHSHNHHERGVMIWDGPPEEAHAYLEAVDEIRYLMDTLHVTEGGDTLERVHSAHQMAMGRLLEEFTHGLHHHSMPLEPERLHHSVSRPVARASFRPHDEGALEQAIEEEEEDPTGPEEEGTEEVKGGAVIRKTQCQNLHFKDAVSLIYLVRPAAVKDLRAIAKRLIAGKQEQECCQAYTAVRRGVLEDTLTRLGVERLSIEEIQKTSWESLEDKIKKWIQAFKVAVRVLFAREKDLCNQIFEDNDSAKEFCFSETCRSTMMRLLGFSEAVAISRRSPEKLFRILDIYETLSDLIPDINYLFCEQSCEGVRVEAAGILVRLGEAARCTFQEFANAIQRETSRRPIPGGAVHPLTRYVMNYIRFLFDYTDTLKLLIVNINKKNNNEDQKSPSPPRKWSFESGDRTPLGLVEEDDDGANSLSSLSQHLFSVLELLKNNLEGKSKLYKDSALSYLFLMNNVHYIVQKVRGSELITHLGEDWVRKHSGQVRQYATNYQRAAWNKVLSCLRDEGMHFAGAYSNSVSKGTLKERFKRFNTAFEEVYKVQTNWTVPDHQLREELRISITEKLLPAYRSFMGRFGIHLEGERHAERYLKYTPEDLENYLLDLFEGLPGSSMHTQRSKSLP
uniref:Exocyst subunit Exo70 family protein n=1 Tax=Araucaria cunninghamii TaxID=56994 RepID=A0A0D6QZR5_ARACU